MVITLFALITLFMNSSVIFDLFGIRAKEGNYVLFVVLSNFVFGFIYLVAAIGFIKLKRWTTHMLIFSLVILILTFIVFLIHINSGGLYEMQTVKAMIFRILMTSLFAGISWNFISRKFSTGKVS